MLAIAARSHILKSVRFPILPLNYFSQVLGAVVDLAGLVDAHVGAASRPAPKTGEGAGELLATRLPIPTQPAERPRERFLSARETAARAR